MVVNKNNINFKKTDLDYLWNILYCTAVSYLLQQKKFIEMQFD